MFVYGEIFKQGSYLLGIVLIVFLFTKEKIIFHTASDTKDLILKRQIRCS